MMAAAAWVSSERDRRAILVPHLVETGRYPG
jgi:hypothetical protein